MYQLLRAVPVRQLLVRQIPNLGLSFVIAELFYKFHSFTLECVAFLATWFVLDAVTEAATRLLKADHKKAEQQAER